MADSKQTQISKPWGSERIWAQTDRLAGKVIQIQAGDRLSLQYHREKEEAIYVLKGSLKLYIAESGASAAPEDQAKSLAIRVLCPGESALIPVGTVHRFEAVEDVELIEISTPELDDVVRIEDDYGRI